MDFFNTKKIKELEQKAKQWEDNYRDVLDEINILIKEKADLQKEIDSKNLEMANFKKICKENEIMKKYYKLDEEPSLEVQAKVLADLRLHDMKFNIIQNELERLQLQLAQNQFISSNSLYYNLSSRLH